MSHSLVLPMQNTPIGYQARNYPALAVQDQPVSIHRHPRTYSTPTGAALLWHDYMPPFMDEVVHCASSLLASLGQCCNRPRQSCQRWSVSPAQEQAQVVAGLHLAQGKSAGPCKSVRLHSACAGKAQAKIAATALVIRAIGVWSRLQGRVARFQSFSRRGVSSMRSKVSSSFEAQIGGVFQRHLAADKVAQFRLVCAAAPPAPFPDRARPVA